MAALQPVLPPNGGTKAWSQVFGTFLMYFTTWGILQSFGAFQSYYQQTYLSDYSPSDISWIGTIQGFFIIFMGIIAGPLGDKGYTKLMAVVGSFLVVLGLMMTSLATQYYSVFLSLGVTTGLGSGLLFTPGMVVLSSYFTSKRPIAMGISSLGSSLGGTIYPIVFRQVLDLSGYGWACRAMGFLALFTLAVYLVLLEPLNKTKPGASKAPAPVKYSDIFHSSFVVFAVGTFLTFMGLLIPFFYIPLYGETQVGTSSDLSFYLLAILNAGGVPGRLLSGLLAMRIGPLPALAICTCISGVLGFIWPVINNTPGLIVHLIIYGFFYGAVISLGLPTIAALSRDPKTLGMQFGVNFAIMSLGVLIGNPLAGVIVTKPHGFLGQGIFAGVSQLVGFGLFIFAEILHRREGPGHQEVEMKVYSPVDAVAEY